MSGAADAQLEALRAQYDAAVAELAGRAAAARARVDGDIAALQELAGPDTSRPPLIAGIPVDEPPPYVPPPHAASANALIPDTPLVDSGGAGASSLAFDDAPLWQN